MIEYTVKIEYAGWKRPRYISNDPLNFSRHLAGSKRWKTHGGAQRWLNQRPGYMVGDYGYTCGVQQLQVEYKGRTRRVKAIREINL